MRVLVECGYQSILKKLTRSIAQRLVSYVIFFQIIAHTTVVSATPIVSSTGDPFDLVADSFGAIAGITFSPDGELFATDYQRGEIIKISSNVGSNTLSPTIVASGIPFPTDLVFTPDGRLFVASSTSSNSYLYEIMPDGSTSVFASGLSFPTSLAYFSDHIYVAASGNGTIIRIDMSGNKSVFISDLSAPNGPYGLSFDRYGNLYFTDHGTGNVLVSDSFGQISLLGSIMSLGSTGTGIGPNGRLYVSDVLANEIVIFDRQGGKDQFAFGFSGKSNPPTIGPHGIAFSRTGEMFVADGSSIHKTQITRVPEPSPMYMIALVASCLFLGRLRSRQTRHGVSGRMGDFGSTRLNSSLDVVSQR